MIEELFEGLNKKAVSPVIAIVLLLMMTVAAAGAAYFWLTTMQSRMQKSAGGRIEAITKSVSTRVIAQATICEGINEVNLKAYWKMDEGEGNKTHDSSKNESTGTLYPGLDGSITTDSQMWVEGKAGNALRFDGNDSYVNVPNKVAPNPPAMTLAVWAKTNDPSASQRVVWNLYSANAQGYGVKINDGNWKYGFGNGTDYFQYKVFATAKTEWQFATITYSDGTAKAYLNGDLKDTDISLSGDLEHSDRDLRISGETWNTPPNAPMNGTIDEVRIYDRALSQAQVEYLNDTNKAMGRYVNITVYNAGTEEVPEGTWVANLKKDGTTVDSDSYNASKLPPEERVTLNFYFDKMKPNKEYTIELEGTATSTTVSC